ALRRAGIRRLRFHGLRHTYVSSLIEYGVTNVKRLQTLLGHSSAMITLDTYTHLLPDTDDGIAAASESALFGSGSKTVAVDSRADAEASASV
ncbi:MAG: tyrosine-type recombinase/integrase, partial [Proteobacteria bacterium]|nr:tyrosine-type recombinase/integrase [Pseudomonadota bacterium]